ncbi:MULTISPECIES: hypothetical protein [unclassified Pseudoalteromonas]|uniref:hypothetical protein n=1 Tax=unclassified Pseudoalteromonas TaxID=194690 RepID=UPI001F3A5490|nr:MULTISPECIES: hypothetical protein [unclassified Pseudoalteromonas]MCF2829704.1 hypothetical protein [Pseudoalteromonas sp. OF5H-5]MCF2832612.1 hypothetical protein [Pseudoalteromonas sp. DL2-H6]MCF2927594.1 hypothetical protein [Pseudoalteromonas sp. DL2-H1]
MKLKHTLIALGLLSLHSMAKDVIVRYEQPPWHTNQPYMDDEYSIQYGKESVKRDKVIDSNLLKCRKKEYSYTERMNCITQVENDNPHPMLKRGSDEYIQAHYINKLSSGTTATKLKTVLLELSDTRKKTRQVTQFGKPKLGELTFEQVNREICEIERIIGFLSSGKYCVR